MVGPDPHDDTSADHEQLETELLAQDRDAASVATADVDDATARSLVDDLIDADVVTPVPEDRVLVHEPSVTTFDSTTQLAVFHRGWTAGRDADAEAE
ncbi:MULTISPECIES: hypothetical protein [Halobacteriales]|jgi:hypothetical protein|uniref:DUF8069 domain-containing protein n=2 Tax=Halobacteriales TaxID=2235 RepID=A0A830F843_9EURY|nr:MULTISPECIES: hypothetical protein [Halobacteria]MCF2208222.1 hypothetical protein [Halobacterium salinarum]MCF2240248.1 hypothetical protein [Halobacterium salinarum]MDL0130857.1 hypothetical protein [Halobacterium salinarum]MDT3437588.1 hypothetical protein [Haloarcula sp. 1CSR25-25]QKY18508.1 hypothetical protein Hrr1229_016405 [Halorubrum sp. CBA1229]